MTFIFCILAVHPNYPEKHEDKHRPHLHQGLVIKQNANQRYATTSPGMVILKEVARRTSAKLQEFVVRNDSPCGSTIGKYMYIKIILYKKFQSIC